MQFTVRTYLNDGPGRFWEYQPGDRLHEGPVVVVDVDPDPKEHRVLGTVTRSREGMEAEALNRVWAIGNNEGTAANGDRWPGDRVRSLSCGDVLVIGETAWAIARVGFVVIEGADLATSTGPQAVDNARGVFGPCGAPGALIGSAQ